MEIYYAKSLGIYFIVIMMVGLHQKLELMSGIYLMIMFCVQMTQNVMLLLWKHFFTLSTNEYFRLDKIALKI